MRITIIDQPVDPFTAIFTRYILGSSAGDNYTEMLEQERAKSMARDMNLGIAEALVKQFGHGARKPSGN